MTILATMLSNQSAHDDDTCEKLLRECEMFHKVQPKHLSAIAQLMDYKVLTKGQVLLQQDQPSDRFFLLESGNIKRKRVDGDGKTHNVEFAIKAKSINSMRIISGEPSFSTVTCTSAECHLFEMKRERFLNMLQEKPELSVQIAEGLCEELRKGSKKYSTPMLEQTQTEVNLSAVSIAAGIESYYRSALNAKINQSLTGVKASYFPNMHIQVPTRITYICGFKLLRSYFDQNVQPEAYNNNETAVRLGTAVAPGIIMTPVSSILEATNAGHLNPEPMHTRWMRGIVPRAGREIIFGVGLNQMSDYFQERLEPLTGNNPMLANALGSLSAGVVSGYLSHVPHNLSTLKLLDPTASYGQLYAKFVQTSVPPSVEHIIAHWPAQTLVRSVLATLWPRGVMVRTAQIVGSFIILNGTINYLQLKEHLKIQRAIGAV
ncbi:hypothetical protein FisN_18Hh295 [Fistulifera solaris]|uniref:Cyclic nucleotide-binding domain-containing protein n=1 Tax=Fistulifera solaris TaxID=1519565 RepID=A0A1Z5KIY5_FISSO|nr:hypothetical protein FisN_18Hh295 [Fistulifera solaris]|eukprot:GAX26177.1 hypothetical protein FisN_18Hh295 [Fistulifera solaris]